MTAPAPTVRTIGRYALYQAIASGGMATIYVGRLLGPVGFARTVAVKRLHPHYAADRHFATMFLDEARLAARIRHPNVVPTLDVVATHGELFLIMEYVHGESIAKLVRAAPESGHAMPIPVVVAAMSGALLGLGAAHDARSERGEPLQIIHRDVSPQNILLGLDGQARLIDFGVARAEGQLHKTQAGQVKGKIAYMSPEQVRGEDIDPTTDVYAAGVVAWEALTGRRLYKADGDGGLVVQVLEGHVVPPSEALRSSGDDARAAATAPLDAIVMKALSRDKGARFQTARELARALEAAVAPATAAQVSDWVESAAGEVLRQRAALIAEIESSSAFDLTTGEFRSAIGAPSVRDVRLDAPTASVPTLSQTDLPPATTPAPAGEDGPVPSATPSLDAPTVSVPRAAMPEPSVRAPIFIESALAEPLSGPPAPAEPAPLPQLASASARGATLLSVSSPIPAKDRHSASPAPRAHLGQTLHSPESPLAATGRRTAESPSGRDGEPASVYELPRSRSPVMFVLAGLVVLSVVIAAAVAVSGGHG
jgi:serine/threonine-protein kinase